MPTPKNHRKGAEDKSRRGKLSQRASSFHGPNSASMAGVQLLRPRTVPDLLSGIRESGAPTAVGGPPKLTKLLLNVTVQRSLGAVQVLMSPESTVGDLIATALRQYVKEGRRPLLTSADASTYYLHYSQFSLESLDREEKLMALGSRNFFLCPKKSPSLALESGGGGGGVATSSRCSEEAGESKKNIPPWLKFMNFLF